MASDTVPAAVPGPNTPPDSTATTLPAPSGTQQPADGLAGLLAPVQPVRATFNLTPDQAAEMADGEQAVTDASSAGFNTENTPENSGENGKKTTAGKQEKSVVRAWLLAGAERWRKGADARNKRLEVKKARAQARQVKETVTVNRSNAGGGLGSLGGGKSSSGGGGKGGGGKDLSSKTRKPPSSGPKNSTSSSGASGRTNSGGRGTGSGGGRSEKTAHPKPTSGKGGKDTARKTPGTGNSGSGGSGGSGAAGKGMGGKDTAAHRKPSSDKGGHKPAKDHGSGGQRTNSTGSGSGTGGKAGAQGPAGKPGKDANSGKDRPWKNRTSTVDLNKDKPKPKRTDGKGQDRQDRGKTPKPGDGGGTTPAVKTPKTTDAKDTPKKATDKPAPSGKDQTAGSGKDPKKQQPTSPNPAPQPRVDTRSSREAGYRDGTRVGKVVAHTQAYRDGYRDGRTDTAQAAARDKQRLDQAHTQRKQTRTQPDKDQPVTQPIPPKPTHAPGQQPVPVNRVDSTHIHLGPGANRTSISRGEVRRLCDFQKRLTHKKDRLVTIADATRTLEEHAKEQAKKITQLLEQARGVKGGQKLVAALTKLNEAATLQAGKAGEINRRALRSLEACKSLAGNTEARYGGIYKAVVDSPETSPAEMKYYREMGYANV
ncbi:hypothetical protein ABZ485_28200 [Streptomyces albogriseolus]|uniref:hypothetical protein n=1 Tax=Streptomyces albogriseolus TaxID=1887 RepID=UPI00345F2909